MEKMELIRECIWLFKIITSKENGVNRRYSSKLPIFDDTIFTDVSVLFDEDGNDIWRSYEEIPMPTIPNSYLKHVDIAFSPQIHFGNPILVSDDVFGENGLYENMYICVGPAPNEAVDDDIHLCGLFTISSRDELFVLMEMVKNHWDWYANIEIQFAQNIKALQQDLRVFVLELQTDFSVFKNIQGDIPVVFEPGNSDECFNINGQFDPNGSDKLVRIFNCQYESDYHKLTMAMRHEVIHYCLHNAGLPCQDGSGVFWYLAKRYNANPYKELSPLEAEIFDTLLNLTQQEADYFLKGLAKKLKIC